MSALEEYRRVWPGGEISRLADAAIAELEANDVVRTQWTYDFVDGMARSAGLLIHWRCEQAEAEVERLRQLAHDAIAFLMTPHVGASWPVEVAIAVEVLRKAEKGE